MLVASWYTATALHYDEKARAIISEVQNRLCFVIKLHTTPMHDTQYST